MVSLCDYCKYNKRDCCDPPCNNCNVYNFNEFKPDWVTLISTYFHVSRNQAKKIYHNMLADYRIRNVLKRFDNA